MSFGALFVQNLIDLADQAALPEVRSIVLQQLTPNEQRLAIGALHSIYPASMIKVPLVAVTFADVASGRLRFEDRFPVAAANMTANDSASPLVPGYETTLSEITNRAISFSDNVATNMLFDILGRERATDIARRHLGLEETFFHRKLSGSEPLIVDAGWNETDRNAHSAADAVRLFAAIAQDRIPYAQRLRASLAAQFWNEKLNCGLRTGDTFAHKTGDTDEVTHDGGILTTAEGRSYALAVYTQFASNDDHNARLGEFMRLLRRFL